MSNEEIVSTFSSVLNWYEASFIHHVVQQSLPKTVCLFATVFLYSHELPLYVDLV